MPRRLGSPHVADRKDRVASEPLRLADLPPASARHLPLSARPSLCAGSSSSARSTCCRSVTSPACAPAYAWAPTWRSSAPCSPGRSGGSPSAALPELRAIEALGIVIALFLVLFSRHLPGHVARGARRPFTQRLDHTRALYFTVSIFSTVGFGDITPEDRPGAARRRGADAARPRHHRRRRPPHLQCGPQPHHSGPTRGGGRGRRSAPRRSGACGDGPRSAAACDRRRAVPPARSSGPGV